MRKQKGSIPDESKNVHSVIPSCMNRERKWVIIADETLKVKKHIVVITRQILNEKTIEEIEILSSNHVFVKEIEKEIPNERYSKISHIF